MRREIHKNRSGKKQRKGKGIRERGQKINISSTDRRREALGLTSAVGINHGTRSGAMMIVLSDQTET